MNTTRAFLASLGLSRGDDAEIERMVALGRERNIEVSLFTGPRAAWDVGVQATTNSGRTLGGSLRGTDQLVYGIEDVRRGCELGVRSVLVADLGQLWVLAPRLYPSGGHLRGVAIDTARARVRRAAIGLGMLKRYYPEAQTG